MKRLNCCKEKADLPFNVRPFHIFLPRARKEFSPHIYTFTHLHTRLARYRENNSPCYGENAHATRTWCVLHNDVIKWNNYHVTGPL